MQLHNVVALHAEERPIQPKATELLLRDRRRVVGFQSLRIPVFITDLTKSDYATMQKSARIEKKTLARLGHNQQQALHAQKQNVIQLRSCGM